MNISDPGQVRRFIARETKVTTAPIVPEIRLYLATEATDLWEATEAELHQSNLPPPYWAFAWAGGQALARHILDHPDEISGRACLDFGSGSGLVAIAAMMAGAARVTAAEVDPVALVAMEMNAALNGVTFDLATGDVLEETPPPGWLILAGDVCYEQPMADRLVAWLERAVAARCEVWLGDPGRSYLPRGRLEGLSTHRVPTPMTLEDREMRETTVSRFTG